MVAPGGGPDGVRMLLPLTYLLIHAAALWALPAQAEAVSFAFLLGAPLLAAGTCLWRSRGNLAASGWIALAIGLLLWAGGMAVNMLQIVVLDSPSSTSGASVLLYVLYGVPLTFALASHQGEAWTVRLLDALMAMALGLLFFVHTFTFATLSSASEEGLHRLALMLDVENAFIAVFSVMRWLASGTAAQRHFHGSQAAFACVYLVVAAYINHGAPSDSPFGLFWDLLIDVPFLLLAALALRPVAAAPPAWRLPRLASIVRAGSPLLLPISVLATSALMLGAHPRWAIGGFVFALLGYGARSVLQQLRAMAEREELHALARVDTLTGLANRREFDAVLEREWRRARRSGEPLSLLMIDIDHFKRLNDSSGHQVGDAHLRAVARALATGCTRATDVVTRYGGEEFAVILPATDAQAAQALAERLRAAVEALRLHAPDPGPYVTVSIGVGAAVAMENDDPAALLEATDAALYDAKRAGRNRLAFRSLAPGAGSAPALG